MKLWYLSWILLIPFLTVDPPTEYSYDAVEANASPVIPPSEDAVEKSLEVQAPSQSPANCNCTLYQGSFSAPLPYLVGSGSVASFYSYGNPIGASANTGLEVSNNVIMMLYEDSTTGDVSFVFIADAPNDGAGGQVDINLECMPSSAFLAVGDEPSEISGAPPSFTGNFIWSPCCTDGGAIGGLGCDISFSVDVDIISGLTGFQLVHGTVANPTYVTVPNFDCPFIIDCGGTFCCENTFDVSANITDTNCESEPTGAIDITTDCVSAPVFQWSNGATTEDINNLLPGSYTLTVTDGLGCSEVNTYTINAAFPDPMPVISGPTSFCTGQVATLSVSGNYTSYLWSTGQQTSTIFVNTPGTYSVTVTNAGGCTGTASITVEEYPLPDPMITGPSAFCFGEEVTLATSEPYASYLWSTGETSSSIIVEQPGGYAVTVTNSFGCSFVDLLFLAVLPEPTPIISGPASLCAGQSGTLSVSSNFTSFEWSTGETSSSINISSPGTYEVSVTNEFDCEGTASLEVLEAPSPDPQINGPAGICLGDTVTLSLNSNYSSVLWSTNEMTTSIEVTTPGLYWVEVADSLGCPGADSLQLDTLSNAIIQINGPSELCEGDTATLDAGQGYDSYLWSTGSTEQTIEVLSGGTYEVTASSNSECPGVGSLQLNLIENDTTTTFLSSCNPQDTGVFVSVLTNISGCDSILIETVDLLPSDTNYLMNPSCNPQDTGVFINSFTNQFGCDSTVIETVDLLPSDTTYLFSTSCNPLDTGIFQNILVNQFGCDSLTVSTVSYSLADTTYISSTSCNPQDTGQFIITYSNQFGCDSLEIETVSFSEADSTFLLGESCNPQDTGLFITTFTNQIGCDSLVFETINLLPSDTTYLEFTSCNPQDTGLFVNAYVNQFGCDSTVFETINLLPSDTTYLVDQSCNPQDTGLFVNAYTNQFGCDSTVFETVSFLLSDTTYLFDQSCNPQDTGLFVNAYTNQSGCDSIVIETVILLPSDTLDFFSESCNPQDTGFFVNSYINQFGCDSTVFTTVTLLPSDTISIFNLSCITQDTGVFVNSYANQFGCDSTVIETIGLLPSDTTFIFDQSCNPQDTGLLVNTMNNQFGCDSTIITFTGLYPSDTLYLFDVSCNPQDTGLFVDSYANQFGCDSTVIQQVDFVPNDTLFFFDQTCNPQDTGLFVFQYADQSGCDSIEVYDIALLPMDSCMLSVDFDVMDVACDGEANGQISLDISGGVLPVVINWMATNGSSSGSDLLTQFGDLILLDGLAAGSYIISCTDQSGLGWEEEITVNAPPPLSAFIDQNSNFFGYAVSCFGGSDGSIEGSAQGGTLPYTFNWSTNQDLSNLPAGNYELTVTDANNCASTASIVLEEPAPLQFDLTAEDPGCAEGGRISIQDISGGIPPYLISLNGGSFADQQAFEDLSPGSHTLTVQDAADCAASQEVWLNEIPEYWADLGPDTIIPLGTSLELQLQTNLIPYDSVIWSPGPAGFSCTNCASLQVDPLEATLYQVIVRDENGCEVMASKLVDVQRVEQVYIPNVITPDNDGINDVFTIYGGPSVTRIREMIIFDRWGDMIFQQSGFPPGDLLFGWDGRHKGEPVSAGVYVFYAEVEYLNGDVESFSGDITVFR